MKRFFSAKIIIILITALVLAYFDSPTGFHKIPGTPNFIKNAKIHLGLDLQGGSQLDYKIDLREVPEPDQKAIIEGVKEVINRRVNGLGVSEPNIYISEIADETHVIVELAGIKDLDEAKATVGKTIQLEFKEEKEGFDPGEKERFRTQANDILKRAGSADQDFALLGQEEELANPGQAKYLESEFVFRDGIVDENVADVLFAGKAGSVISRVIEGSEGYTVDITSGGIVEDTGFFILKVLERNEDVEREDITPKEVLASHILIAYEGAERAAVEITRSKREAKKLAEEVLEKALAAPDDFTSLAGEFSDEPGAETSGGELTDPVKQGSSYAIPFTEGTLKIENEGEILNEIVETEFGYHVIKANKVTPEIRETHLEPQIKYAKIFVSARPDPWKETGLTGEHFRHADVQFDNLYQPTVAIKFNDEGAKLFETLTERNAPRDGVAGKRIAIFVGGNLVSAPVVQQKISGGNAVITGSGSIEDANNLARDLNTGAIPAPILLVGQYTIGASLGQDALQTSLLAGLIGLVVLALYMLVYYRLPGFIADLALLVYSAILIFLIKAALPIPLALAFAVVVFIALIYKILNSKDSGWEKLLSFILSCFLLFFISFLLSTPVVLTLAGVAGIILSIGMAVDANILIFERTKEELRAKRPLSSAIEIGFDRAWASIRDSNFSSLITAGILFYFGTSIIRGFALMLAAGIIISMFTAITITRTFLMGFVKTHLAEKLSLFCPNIDGEKRKPFRIVEKSKIWAAISGGLIAVAIISILFNGINLGMDFKGGTLMEIQFTEEQTEPITAEGLHEVLNELQTEFDPKPAPSAEDKPSIVAGEIPNVAGATIISSGENQFLFRMENMDETVHQKLLGALEEKFGLAEEMRFQTIGPTISQTMQKRALIALSIAIIAIVLYVSFAFRKVPKHVSAFKFGISAIIALVHDVLIVFGIFALFGFEIDALFITAILTILGFSVHDTIVVLDRLRENLRGKHYESFKEITNISLTETMARSINTSISTLFTLVALLIFGSQSIFLFVLALVIGVIIGTYSSIFVASPILAKWQKDVD